MNAARCFGALTVLRHCRISQTTARHVRHSSWGCEMISARSFWDPSVRPHCLSFEITARSCLACPSVLFHCFWCKIAVLSFQNLQRRRAQLRKSQRTLPRFICWFPSHHHLLSFAYSHISNSLEYVMIIVQFRCNFDWKISLPIEKYRTQWNSVLLLSAINDVSHLYFSYHILLRHNKGPRATKYQRQFLFGKLLPAFASNYHDFHIDG